MPSDFDVQRERIAATLRSQREQLATQERAAQEQAQAEARQQISDIEVQKQQALAGYYAEQEKSRRGVALGTPYVSQTEGIRAVEQEAKRITGLTEAGREKGLKDISVQVQKAKKELGEWETTSLTAVREEEGKWKEGNVLLDTGEWTPKDKYDALTSEDRKLLNQLGVDKFNETKKEQQEQFETENVKLDTGEWMPKDKYEALGVDDKNLLNQVGIGEFNKQQGTKLEEFKAVNVEIRPGEWYPKNEWESLTPSQREEVIDTGSYTVIPATGEEALRQLKNAGKVHELATLQGYNPETGEITYIGPKTDLSMSVVEDYWSQLTKDQQRIQINGALGKNVRAEYKPYSELTSAEKDQVLRFYSESYLPYQAKDIQYFKDLWGTQKLELKAAGIGLIPVVGTIYNWNNMSPVWRAVSIATDILVLAPFAGVAVRTVRTAAAPISTAAKQLAKAELAAVKGVSSKLKVAYGGDVAKAYTTMSKAQTAYLKNLANVAELARRGKVISAAKRALIDTSERALRTKAKRFVTDLGVAASKLKGVKGEIPVRFDSPEVAKLIRDLPNDVVRNTRAAAEALAPTTDIKTLKVAVNKAEMALKVAQERHPTDPSKWVDLMYELTKAQAKLAQASTGSVDVIYKKLLAAREAGKTAEATKLQGELASAIRNMEIEWARGGFLSRGGVAIETKPISPITPKMTKPGITRVRVIATTATRTFVAIGETAIGEWVSPKVTTTPEIIKATEQAAKAVPKIGAMTNPDVISITEAALRAFLKASLEGKTVSEIQAETIRATEIVVEPLMDNKTLTQSQAETVTKTAVKVATKVGTQIRTGLKYRLIPKDESKKKGHEEKVATTLKVPAGTWTWKQGIGWHRIEPDYSGKKPLFSFNPPEGAVNTDLRTPEETIQIIGSKKKVPERISIDLGVEDIYLKKSPKPSIRFVGGGLKTIVGQRIMVPEKGMSIPSSSGIRVSSFRRKKTRRELVKSVAI